MLVGASLQEKTDVELVALVRRGDKDAFGILTQRYHTLARRLVLRLVARDDLAQDLAQEAMLQAYLSIDRLRDPAKFKSWLYGIVLNICRSHLRNREISFFSLEAMMEGLQFFPAPFSSPVLTPEKIAEERELHQTVLDVINTLPSRDRDATLLFYYAQLSLQEIAVVQGISLGAVKVRLHRARQRFKEKLLLQHPEILPGEKRRKKMIRVTIADVIRMEQKDGQELPLDNYVVALYDEVGRRLMLIWIGPAEGESIAIGLSDLAFPRPLTHRFYSSLLQSINARVEGVSVVALKKDTFYAVVKMRCGKKTCEIDARPSDAIALAVLNDVPIFVAEEVLESAGGNIPKNVKGSPNRKGLEKIVKGLEERFRKNKALSAKIVKKYQEMSQEDKARRNEEFIASVFGE